MRLTKQIMFEAGSDAEALEIARQKLGRDAVILSSQVVKKGGFLGLFRKRSLLVTAGILEEDEPQGVQAKQERLIAFQQLLEAQKRSSADKLELSEKAKSGEIPALLEGIKEIRSILTRIENQKVQRSSDEPPQEKSPFYQQLLSAGVESHLAQKLLKDYEASGAQDAIRWLSGYIRVIGGDFASALGGRRVMLIGPTGVGKTTTIAKLAAIHSLWERRKVLLLTADTYRIAAVEQLRTYARILGIPIEVIFEPKDYDDVLARHGDAEVVFLDVAGRSQRDDRHLEEYERAHDAFKPDAVHLVLQANVAYPVIVDVVRRMSKIPISCAIFTKLDEAMTYGVLLNFCLEFGRPISFLTTGQNVPSDIEVAEPSRIAKLVMGVERFGSV